MGEYRAKRNLELRKRIKDLDIRLYELAEAMHIGISTLARWLNERENSEHIEMIKRALQDISENN